MLLFIPGAENGNLRGVGLQSKRSTIESTPSCCNFFCKLMVWFMSTTLQMARLSKGWVSLEKLNYSSGQPVAVLTLSSVRGRPGCSSLSQSPEFSTFQWTKIWGIIIPIRFQTGL